MMNKYIEILRNLNMLHYPLICPFLVGLNLPEIVDEKRYYRIPFLVCFPVLYTGVRMGNMGTRMGDIGTRMGNMGTRMGDIGTRMGDIGTLEEEKKKKKRAR
jgi:hypothetical protein